MTAITAIKERPILFRGEMVRAILAGKKTQTRRPVKPQPEVKNGIFRFHKAIIHNDALDQFLPGHPDLGCPYGQPGDRLWVRETWRSRRDHELLDCVEYRSDLTIRKPKITDENDGHRFHEDCDRSEYEKNPWRPSIHMPRWASRILLEITNVRVERIRDISQRDAMAEGYEVGIRPFATDGPPKHRFVESWNSTYPGSWDRNDWVWVIDFRLTEPVERGRGR